MKKIKLEKILLVPDTHVPYHDKKALELVHKVAAYLKPDQIVIGGDFIDNYTVSAHSKDPNRALRLKEEVVATIKELEKIKKLGAKKLVFLGGNHEDRLERYLMDKAPELYNIISTPKILELERMGYKYHPYKESYRIGKLVLTHDLGKAGRTAHLKALDDAHHNIVIFHTHRLGYAVEGNINGDKHVGAMLGWLGDVETIDYKHKALAKKEWALAFGVAYHDPSTGNVHVQPVPIVNYSCVVEGKKFSI